MAFCNFLMKSRLEIKTILQTGLRKCVEICHNCYIDCFLFLLQLNIKWPCPKITIAFVECISFSWKGMLIYFICF